MFKEILTKNQQELFLILSEFSNDYYLVGGTAIALQIGHRRSIDYDLFTNEEIKRMNIKRRINQLNFKLQEVIYEAYDQLHVLINSVKLTFFNYPYKIEPVIELENLIKMPSLLDLSAMKALSFGGRAKWKDYVDLYFLLKDHIELRDIVKKAKYLFRNEFNEKLFREQLAYFEDIDYSESIDYVNENIENKKIQSFLMEASLLPF